jgi:hypothetical protein
MEQHDERLQDHSAYGVRLQVIRRNEFGGSEADGKSLTWVSV